MTVGVGVGCGVGRGLVVGRAVGNIVGAGVGVNVSTETARAIAPAIERRRCASRHNSGEPTSRRCEFRSSKYKICEISVPSSTAAWKVWLTYACEDVNPDQDIITRASGLV